MIAAFGVFLIIAGAFHFINPAFYDPFMPDWFPKTLANYASGIAEILIGIAMLWPSYKTYGIWAAFGLMVLFLPVHIFDLLREQSAIGSKLVASIRLVIQFLLIGWLWWLARKYT